jgi:hypothetical protein
MFQEAKFSYSGGVLKQQLWVSSFCLETIEKEHVMGFSLGDMVLGTINNSISDVAAPLSASTDFTRRHT